MDDYITVKKGEEINGVFQLKPNQRNIVCTGVSDFTYSPLLAPPQLRVLMSRPESFFKYRSNLCNLLHFSRLMQLVQLKCLI